MSVYQIIFVFNRVIDSNIQCIIATFLNDVLWFSLTVYDCLIVIIKQRSAENRRNLDVLLRDMRVFELSRIN